ncbi:Saccharopine dehydrogenase [Exophiala xenobiotica]|uniref:Saccharopine dehydrogenase [NAD(+), L-lysine-forming] n=1 Tax=Lithohypha guttulata TaxID=1690604 RepID=A0ABR0K979_9EURO|nr:Saccharopine dehydrogenase [Lithohypha guttulata]KAK5326924.1 Saccharopine dehydrogenase [Exophiala xenobiotica]
MAITLHLRSESKPLEHRSALTPSTTKALLEAGYKVNVERSPVRIFDDEEFEKVGATLVPEGSWVDAPTDHIIVGLKELPEDKFALKHTHVQFAHCYKNQGGWEEVLSRFPQGGGTLLDLEFLTDDAGRRVAAFGYHAGYAGAALAVEAWAYQLQHPEAKTMPAVSSYPDQDALLSDVRAKMQEGEAITKRKPQVLVIGALGRCGRGAVDLCKQAGIPDENILKWDMAETAKGGPFDEIIESDIFVNCIYLSEEIPPFVNDESLKKEKRNLSVICDVSCDTTNPHNPVPVYTENSTFSRPTLPVPGYDNPPISVISIDHLPSLLPREASEAFSQALLPSLLELKDRQTSRVWQQAEGLFSSKVGTLPESMRSTFQRVADSMPSMPGTGSK